MPDSELSAKLSKWEGYSEFCDLLAKHGLQVPLIYRRSLSEELGYTSDIPLKRYWDELAKEYVRNGGNVESETRKLNHSTVYRSEYLDNLAKKILESGRELVRGYPLLPEYRLYEELRAKKPELALKLSEKLDAKKELEYPLISHQEDLVISSNRDKQKVFFTIASSLGWQVHKSTAIKHLDNLQIQLDLDIGRSNTINYGINLITLITDQAHPNVKFFVQWGRVIPGFGRYNQFSEVPSLMLGLHANLYLSDAFFQQLCKM